MVVAAPSESAVRCRGLTKTFGTGPSAVPALRGVDLDLDLGEVLMVLGPSGSGKTTLLSILTGILEPDAGEYTVLGRDLRGMSEKERATFRGRSIGFVFQLFHLLPALSAVENVAVPLLIAGRPRQEALAAADRGLEAVGLGERRDERPRRLSGGQQQRVAIARALVHEPALLVCDEPTSNLDHRGGREVMGLLRRLARQPGRALIVVTHDERILDLADRVAHLEDGRVVATEAAAEEVPS